MMPPCVVVHDEIGVDGRMDRLDDDVVWLRFEVQKAD
jgi:hypothetical protein